MIDIKEITRDMLPSVDADSAHLKGSISATASDVALSVGVCVCV